MPHASSTRSREPGFGTKRRFNGWSMLASGILVTEQNIAEYCACLDRADSEKPLQEFLEAQPLLLTAEEGSQCRCVVPRKSLGGMFVPDFLVGRLHSPTFYGS
jgi:hypothetical protein